MILVATCFNASFAQQVITDGDHVGIEYVLKTSDGTTVDTNVGKQTLVYTQGEQFILHKLQEALLGLKVGDKKTVHLSAQDAFGSVDPDAFQEVPIEQVPQAAREPGALLQVSTANGQATQVRVHEVKEDVVVIDGNHPLAGHDLIFDIKIVSIE